MKTSIFTFILTLVLLPSLLAQTTRTVCATDCDFETIQEAINAAEPGDVIEVGDGSFNENLVINKQLTIKSENVHEAVINGSDDGIVVLITEDDVTFEGFTVRNGGMNPSTDANIGLLDVTGVIVNNNNIEKGFYGVVIQEGSGNIVTNNNIEDVVMGVALSNTSDNFVGVESDGITAGGNTIIIPDDGVLYEDNGRGVALTFSFNNQVENNLITSIRYGIQLAEESDNNDIANNNISAAFTGVVILGADNGANHSGINNTIKENIIEVTTPSSTEPLRIGIRLETGADDNTIHSNTIVHDAGYGIWAAAVNNLTVTENVIAAALEGIRVNPQASGTFVINENSITGQSEFAIKNRSDNVTVTATCNWFGTDDFNEIADAISGDVMFAPFLVPNPDGNTFSWSGSDTYSCTGETPISYVDPDGNTFYFTDLQDAIDALPGSDGSPGSGGLLKVTDEDTDEVSYYIKDEEGNVFVLTLSEDAEGNSGQSGLWISAPYDPEP